MPDHPIQAPARRLRIGSNAVTRPPGDWRVLVVPSSCFSMSNGSRFATTTIDAVLRVDLSGGVT